MPSHREIVTIKQTAMFMHGSLLVCLLQVSFEYHRASTRYLAYMNVLAYARICVPVSMRYTSSETNYHYGYTHTKCV